ncbi:MAG: oligosaccharide flippase family protein [bacterium]|nr:oligosaccharide flippase family protein [bacterium]
MSLKQKLVTFLLWSQKYTRTDMVYLAQGGFWLIAGKIVFSVSGFLLIIAFANLLAKETYGTYQYVLSIVSILAIPTLSGMNAAITRAVAQGYEGTLVPAIKTQITWGSAGGLASLGVAGYYFLHHDTTLAISFLIAAFFIPLTNPLANYQAFWTGKKRFDIQTKYNTIIRLLAVSALLLTLVVTKNLILIFLVYFASYALLYFIFFAITVKKIPPAQQQDPEAIPYGKHLSLLDVIGAVASQLDKILLWQFLGAEALAIYVFAVTPVQQAKAFFKTLRPLALVRFSQGQTEKSKTDLLKKVAIFFLVMVFATAAYIIGIPYFYKLFLPQYTGSIVYSQLFAITMLFIPQILLITFLVAQKKTRELYLFQTSFYVGQAILLVILLPRYGILGAIAALTLNQILNFFLLLFLFKSAKVTG